MNTLETKGKVGFISLGCDKNRVDTENAIFEFKRAGYKISESEENSDVLIINTCAFIEPAREEAVNVIENAIANKGSKKIIVTGCFAQRFGGEVFEQVSEIDGIVGVSAYDKLVENVESGKRFVDLERREYECGGRVLTTKPHLAYVKIADGCDNQCSYCVIGEIRGGYRSRKISDIIEEIKGLQGEYPLKEIILVAQDTTRYQYNLLKLLDEIAATKIKWIRLLYCYPELITKELVKKISESGQIVKYIDMPLQHVSDKILKAMNRRNSGDDVRRLVEMIREIDESIAIRSSFICGFPNESEKDFEELRQFIQTYKLDNAGFFEYSKEEKTAAYSMKGHIPKRIIFERTKSLKLLQTKIIAKNNSKYIGRKLGILYEGEGVARSQHQAPNIDTIIKIENNENLKEGEFYEAEILGLDDIDLRGKVL
jgi:ribosomal protein S12 methylthiotransferase